jgi:hypothetical protein
MRANVLARWNAMRPDEFFKDHDAAKAVFDTVRGIVEEFGECEIRTSKSQVAFRRNRGFAYVWRPGQYLRNPKAEAVLSIVLGRHEKSSRFKEVAHPSARTWMHHLEVNDVDELDGEVTGWLREAYDAAG